RSVANALVEPEPVAESGANERREDAGRVIPFARKHVSSYRGEIDNASYGETITTPDNLKELGQAFSIDKAWPVNEIKDAYRKGGDAVGVALAVAARGAMYKSRNEIYPIRSRHNRYVGVNEALIQSVNVFVDSMVVAERMNHQISHPDDRVSLFSDIARTDANLMGGLLINVPTHETIDDRWPDRMNSALTDARFVDIPFNLILNDNHLNLAKRYAAINPLSRMATGSNKSVVQSRTSAAQYLDLNARNSDNMIDLSLVAEARAATISVGDILAGESSRLVSDMGSAINWSLSSIKRSMDRADQSGDQPPISTFQFAYPITDHIENTVNNAAVALDRFVREHHPSIDAARLRPLSLRPSQESTKHLITGITADRLKMGKAVKSGEITLHDRDGFKLRHFERTPTMSDNEAVQAIVAQSREFARIQSEEITTRLMTDLSDVCARIEAVAKEVGINMVDLMTRPGSAISQAEKKLKKNQPEEESAVPEENKPKSERDKFMAMDFGVPEPDAIQMGIAPTSVPDDITLGRSGMIDWRGGVDATEQMMMGRFGITGIQYGEYVTQKQRRVVMNECYDALADMAYALGVPDQFIGLNGLALAFGARGKGGKNAAMAHYEPGLKVINFTRDNGRGTLAHEWGHALDNYIGVANGGIMATDKIDKYGVLPEPVSAVCNFLEFTQKEQKRDPDKEAAESFNRQKFIRDRFIFRAFDEGFRNPAAWIGIARLIAVKQESDNPGTEVDANEIAKTLEGREAEMVRSFYTRLKPVLDKEFTTPRSFFLGRHTARTIYFSRENLMAALVTALNNQASGESGNGDSKIDNETYGMLSRFTNNLYPILSEYWKSSEKGQAKEDKSVARQRGESDFALAGRVLDKRRSGEKYWSKNLEYFARAFSSVVHQTMTDAGVSNDWATAISTPSMFSSREYIASPNIEGGELEAATQVFKSELLPVIQSLAEQLCGERVVTEAERKATMIDSRHETSDSAQTGSLMTQ
ncbi:MAG: LPD1 domain-containing protein, partial [Atribacterota bacterium]|nr:LPD1 domain-containing protein [Atribacterota bacterium]